MTWARFVDPATDPSVRLEGDAVVEYPKLKEFQQVTIRATSLRSEERTGQLVIRPRELVV